LNSGDKTLAYTSTAQMNTKYVAFNCLSRISWPS
jgi:hypothetical protein